VTIQILKLAEIIRDIVQRADIYEEEDFTLNAYHFDTLADFRRTQQTTKEDEMVLCIVDDNRLMMNFNCYIFRSFGSDNPKHPILLSPGVAKGAIYFCFCSSVPKASMGYK